MQPYSRDLRMRVLARCDAGKSTVQVAEIFAVSPAWVRRLKQRRRETGSIDPLPPNSGRKPKLAPADQARLAELVAQKPDSTLAELQAALGVPLHISRICRVLQKLGLSLKKKSGTRPSRTGPTSPRRGRTGTRASPGST